MVDEFKKRRRIITDGLNDIDGFFCTPPKGAFYAFPNIEKIRKSSMELAQLMLRKAKVAVVPGVAFGPQGEGKIRFSFANSKENIQEAIERIGQTVKNII
jgi:aminotransferase